MSVLFVIASSFIVFSDDNKIKANEDYQRQQREQQEQYRKNVADVEASKMIKDYNKQLQQRKDYEKALKDKQEAEKRKNLNNNFDNKMNGYSEGFSGRANDADGNYFENGYWYKSDGTLLHLDTE